MAKVKSTIYAQGIDNRKPVPKVSAIKKTGTREWAKSNVNIQLGCERDCRYCYARSNAVRFKWADNKSWSTPIINQQAVDMNYGRKRGVVMFPSTHDITPNNYNECMVVILKLLDAGNQLLIVSKPNLDCIGPMCERLVNYKKQIEFRFTIGSARDDVLAFWEPGAPGFEERLKCLGRAHYLNYRTSVSAEPFLDDSVENLYIRCFPYVTESFWIGTLRQFNRRVDRSPITVDQKYDFVTPLLACQQPNPVRRLYEKMNGRPLIKWKDSIREMLLIDN